MLRVTLLGSIAAAWIVAALGCDAAEQHQIDEIVVSDQVLDPADRVVLDLVVTEEASFVAVTDETAGVPGEILGHAELPQGIHVQVVIALGRDAKDGETLFATLYRDAGREGTFEAGIDPPALDALGAPLAVSFVATVVEPEPAATVVVEDPYPFAWPWTQLIVERATIRAERGWLVIQDATGDDGGPGDVLAHTALLGGPNRRVALHLSRAAEDGETLWATLYRDEAEVGVWDDLATPERDDNGTPVAVPLLAQAPRAEAGISAASQFRGNPERARVRRVAAAGPSWVVIRADDGGSPGAILGRARRGDGEHENIDVDLSRPVEDAELLWAELRADGGALNTFEPDGPDVTVGDGVSFYVFTTHEPALTLSEQIAVPADRLVVDRVVAPAQGWLVAVGSDGVIGAIAVDKNTTLDVGIPLNREAPFAQADSEELAVALLIDLRTPGTLAEGDELMAGAEVTLLSPQPERLVVADQTLALTHLVTAELVDLIADGWVAAYADNNGTQGELLGARPLEAGVHEAVAVVLDRPISGGGPIWARLHHETAGDGFDPAQDLAVSDLLSQPVATTFDATVPAGTPDFRMVLVNEGMAYRWRDLAGGSVVPAGTFGAQEDNPSLTLRTGARYAVVNEAAANGHPWALVTAGGAPEEDVILLSQAAPGAFDADDNVSWTDDGRVATFTFTPTLAAVADAYRCEVHTTAMRAALSTEQR